jgi:hypothetical protein
LGISYGQNGKGFNWYYRTLKARSFFKTIIGYGENDYPKLLNFQEAHNDNLYSPAAVMMPTG